MYANKVVGRRKALGIDGEITEGTGTEVGAVQSAADAAIRQGQLAALVHKKAVQRLPEDAAMRMGMLKAATDVVCDGSTALQEEIVARFIEDLGKVCAWAPVCGNLPHTSCGDNHKQWCTSWTADDEHELTQ